MLITLLIAAVQAAASYYAAGDSKVREVGERDFDPLVWKGVVNKNMLFC